MYLLIMSFFQTQASGEKVSQTNIGKELERTKNQIAARLRSKNRSKNLMNELDPFLDEAREKASFFFEIPAI